MQQEHFTEIFSILKFILPSSRTNCSANYAIRLCSNRFTFEKDYPLLRRYHAIQFAIFFVLLKLNTEIYKKCLVSGRCTGTPSPCTMWVLGLWPMIPLRRASVLQTPSLSPNLRPGSAYSCRPMVCQVVLLVMTLSELLKVISFTFRSPRPICRN